MQWLERTLLKKPPPPRSHRLRRGLTLKSKAKKNRGESWRELFYRTTAAAAARWWWGATLFLCLSGKAIHAGGKPGCTHCSWLFQVQIRDDDQNSMATGFSLCLLFFELNKKTVWGENPDKGALAIIRDELRSLRYKKSLIKHGERSELDLQFLKGQNLN